MSKISLCVVLYLILTCMVADAQVANKLLLRLHYQWENRALELNKAYPFESEFIQIKKMKFYLSKISLWSKDRLVYQDTTAAYLIKAEDSVSQSITLLLPKRLAYDQVGFCVGTDSITNELGAMSAALDPIEGMYWAWNSGYINIKIEGICAQRSSVHQKFQLHIGGYKAPFSTVQHVVLPVQQSTHIPIHIALHDFFKAINLKEINDIMSPSAKAQTIAREFARHFHNAQ